jgi:hypothetical protein
MAMKFHIEVLCVMTPCSFVVGHRRFGQPCCLHIQGEATRSSEMLVSKHITTRRHNTENLDFCWELSLVNTILTCVGLIPQPRSLTKCLWIEKSIKEGQDPIRTVEASEKKKHYFGILVVDNIIIWKCALDKNVCEECNWVQLSWGKFYVTFLWLRWHIFSFQKNNY